MSSGFDSLKGIGKNKELKVEVNENLEKIVGVCRSIFARYHDPKTREYDKAHPTIMEDVNKSMLKDFDFNANDLRNFIYYTMFNIKNELPQRYLGVFSGSTLNLLTKKNRERGERTSLYINGQGHRFDFLFYRCNNVDELIVEDFCGDDICGLFGERGGNVGRLVLNNNIGDRLGFCAGSYGGDIDTLIFSNNKGIMNANHLGTKGKIDHLFLFNNTGENLTYRALIGNAKNKLYVISNNEIKENLIYLDVFTPGEVGTVLLNNNQYGGIEELRLFIKKLPFNYKRMIFLDDNFKGFFPDEINPALQFNARTDQNLLPILKDCLLQTKTGDVQFIIDNVEKIKELKLHEY